MIKKLTQVEKFYLNTTVTKNGCWIWQGCKSKRGYGQINLGSEGKVLAHRYSYKIHHKNFNSKLNILHKCDTPSCVSPYHLFQGTQKDNMQDKIKKGRHARTYISKINNEQLKQIRESTEPAKIVAARFGICVQYVNQLKRRVRKHYIK